MKTNITSRLRAALQASPTELSNNNIQKYQRNQDAQRQYLGILPPHLAPHGPRTAPECGGLRGHGIGLIYEQLDALTTAQDLLDVLDHDVLDVVELCLSAGDFVRWRS